MAVANISRGRSDFKRSAARSSPSFFGKLHTPRVRCIVPTGRTASDGIPAVLTSAVNAARLCASWTLDVALTSGMQRKCVGNDLGGILVSAVTAKLED